MTLSNHTGEPADDVEITESTKEIALAFKECRSAIDQVKKEIREANASKDPSTGLVDHQLISSLHLQRQEGVNDLLKIVGEHERHEERVEKQKALQNESDRLKRILVSGFGTSAAKEAAKTKTKSRRSKRGGIKHRKAAAEAAATGGRA